MTDNMLRWRLEEAEERIKSLQARNKSLMAQLTPKKGPPVCDIRWDCPYYTRMYNQQYVRKK